MTDTPTTEPRIWDAEDPDITPAEFLIGCCEQRWVGDEQSQRDATGILLAATFMAAGLSLDEAIDAVARHVEGGVTLSLTEEGLQFEFAEKDPEPDAYGEAAELAWPDGPEGP